MYLTVTQQAKNTTVEMADLFFDKRKTGLLYAFLRCTSWFLSFSPARILSIFDGIGEAEMRNTYHNILKHQFYIKLIHTRTIMGLTQAEMAEILSMDDRSYIDLDQGKTCCSAVTLALFLVYVCDDVNGFLAELRHAFEVELKQAA